MCEDWNFGLSKSLDLDPHSTTTNMYLKHRVLHCYYTLNKRLTHILLFFNIDIFVQRAK